MNEEELEALRQQRMSQLREQYQQQALQAQRREEAIYQLRKGAQFFLARAAQDRLDRLRSVQPEKATQAEAIILQLAKNGKITKEKPLTDDDLRELLHKMEPHRETTIEFR